MTREEWAAVLGDMKGDMESIRVTLLVMADELPDDQATVVRQLAGWNRAPRSNSFVQITWSNASKFWMPGFLEQPCRLPEDLFLLLEKQEDPGMDMKEYENWEGAWSDVLQAIKRYCGQDLPVPIPTPGDRRPEEIETGSAG